MGGEFDLRFLIDYGLYFFHMSTASNQPPGPEKVMCSLYVSRNEQTKMNRKIMNDICDWGSQYTSCFHTTTGT